MSWTLPNNVTSYERFFQWFKYEKTWQKFIRWCYCNHESNLPKAFIIFFQIYHASIKKCAIFKKKRCFWSHKFETFIYVVADRQSAAPTPSPPSLIVSFVLFPRPHPAHPNFPPSHNTRFHSKISTVWLALRTYPIHRKIWNTNFCLFWFTINSIPKIFRVFR